MTQADITPIPLTLIETDLAAAAAAFGDAFQRTGFALVSDHGIPDSVLRRAQGAAKALFALPPSAKAAYAIPGGAGQRGYTPFGREAAKNTDTADLKEFWHIGRDLPESRAMPANIWPREWPDFRPATLALYEALDAAGTRLLRAIAVHLGQPPDFFAEPVRDGNSILRLLHYPPITTPAGNALRAAAHEDINVITLLPEAEEAGLQLLHRNGQWQDIAAPPGTLVCNIGDMLQRLSGGRLPSTTHRVANPSSAAQGKARYSMPYFLHFRPDYLIETLPGGPRHWPPITANAYLHERLREIGLL
ncbi:isopenicillin N synthase family dioxygenase [Polymorphobacter sp.]|uniref:isopenicillin N synthase family dioxygenase n=1 Tax=Polymorphobacter sp. TaxID=1909290 RepID=UPI003F711CC1